MAERHVFGGSHDDNGEESGQGTFPRLTKTVLVGQSKRFWEWVPERPQFANPWFWSAVEMGGQTLVERTLIVCTELVFPNDKQAYL